MTLISLAIVCVVLWLVFAYLIPRLPEPLQTVATVLVAIVTIVWLLHGIGVSV